MLTEFEKKLVAYHEVGHAMVAYKQKNTEPVQKITIVPHTQGSLGYTLLMPEEDKTELRTKDELMARITVSMGGRAAEEVVLHTMTNGASQDIQDATAVARNMVAMFGMSEEFGMMALASRRSQYLDGGYGMDCAQGHRRPDGPGGEGPAGHLLPAGSGHHPGQPGGHGQSGGLPPGEGDHHRRGDGGHHRGPGPRHRGLPLPHRGPVPDAPGAASGEPAAPAPCRRGGSAPSPPSRPPMAGRTPAPAGPEPLAGPDQPKE